MCHLVAQCCVSIVLNAEGSEELSEVHLRAACLWNEGEMHLSMSPIPIRPG